MWRAELTSRAGLWTTTGTPDDPRIGGAVIAMERPQSLLELSEGDLALVGICNGRGVRENGGRAGAAEGPLALRRALGRLSAGGLHGRRLFDAGDLGVELVEGRYERVFEVGEEVISALLGRGATVIVVGGGHDCAYATFRGLRRAGHRPAVVNVDAHLDVRPTHEPSSGNPFFRMLESGLESLTEVGLLAAVNAPAQVAYARARGAELCFLDAGVPDSEDENVLVAQRALAAGEASGRTGYLSVDLDAISAAHAPGVSWLNPFGLSPGAVRRIAWSAGHHGARAFDLMELAPILDQGESPTEPAKRDGVTARLAALLVLDFIAGLAARPA